MRRVESPSSINTFKQCPRKYYYSYIMKLPSKPSIHLIRGKAVHGALEDFYDIDSKINSIDDLRLHLFFLFDKYWTQSYSELMELDMDERQIKTYYEESKQMLSNWFSRYRKRFLAQLQEGKSFSESFEHLTPVREEHYKSSEHGVQGFMDAVYDKNDHVVILDYKTSKKTDISEEYRLQLGIYALMYEEVKGKKPSFVGIDFLNHRELLVPVDDKLIQDAIQDLQWVHSKTSSDDIEDYPMKPGPLCKWRTGQCDFYEKCFK